MKNSNQAVKFVEETETQRKPRWPRTFLASNSIVLFDQEGRGVRVRDDGHTSAPLLWGLEFYMGSPDTFPEIEITEIHYRRLT